MSLEKRLGKIQAARFGFGGYQEAMIGASFTLGGDGWGVGDFWGSWAMDPDKNCKWTRDDQSKQMADTVRKLRKTLEAANKDSVEKLVGTPVEITFDGNALKSWRVLTEVV